eukprot:403342846
MQNFDELDNRNNMQVNEKRTFIEQEDRNGFIKKVYGIVFVQLVVTVFITALPMFSTGALTFMVSNPSLVGLALVAAIVIEIALLCCRQLSRTVPTNYYLLGAFTICMGYCVANICTLYDPVSVFSSALMTAGAVGGLTYYAWTTKEDFTIMRGLYSLIFSVLFLTIIMSFFLYNQIMSLFISVLFVLIFGVYLIVDTQMIIGSKRYELSDEDYVLGALIIYLDIINLFLEILKIFGKRD